MQAFKRARAKIDQDDFQSDGSGGSPQHSAQQPKAARESAAPQKLSASKIVLPSQLENRLVGDQNVPKQTRVGPGSSTLRELRKKVARLEEEVHLKTQIAALENELHSPSTEARADSNAESHHASLSARNIESNSQADTDDLPNTGSVIRNDGYSSSSPLSLAAQRRIEMRGGSGYGRAVQPEGSEAQAAAEFRSAQAAAGDGLSSRRAAAVQDGGQSMLHAALLRKLQREMAGLQSARGSKAQGGGEAGQQGASEADRIVPDIHSKLSFAAQRRDTRWAESNTAPAATPQLQALGSAPAAEAGPATATGCVAPECLELKTGGGASQTAGSVNAGGIALTLIKGVGADR